MANVKLRLSHRDGYAPTNQSAIEGTDVAPMLNYNRVIDKNTNGHKDTFDGYTFETDWNGSKDLLRYSGNLFANTQSDGLRFWTTETIGKDRNLHYQIWARSGENLFLPNVIGFTGLWKHNNPQYHPRLDMVCFHYCNKSGTRTVDYRPTEALKNFSESSHIWHYGKTGQHDSGSLWYIGYQLSAARRSYIVDGEHFLHGISLDIDFRTAAGSRTADGTFWKFQPIVSQTGNAAYLANASSCASGDRMVIPADSNTYPVGSSNIKLT